MTDVSTSINMNFSHFPEIEFLDMILFSISSIKFFSFTDLKRIIRVTLGWAFLRHILSSKLSVLFYPKLTKYKLKCSKNLK